MKKIQLKTTSILNVSLQSYEKDFSFLVNGEEFKTSRIISDLLSPKICQLHKDQNCKTYEKCVSCPINCDQYFFCESYNS